MTTRRGFLGGLMAAGLTPRASWADVGLPDFVTAGLEPNGQYILAGLSRSGEVLFRHPLPGRGHAASAHPLRPEVIAFARRPGRFADVLDCRTGRQIARITPPEGLHFYGHGCFSEDGSRLFTTENDYENARGVIGIWDSATYRRIGSFSSGDIGPHDILRHPDGYLVVANGGIETHPESGRTPLNLPTMRSSLAYLSFDGALLEHVALPTDLRLNSIRHLALAPDGTVGFAMQWQGDLGDVVPIVGLHRRGTAPRLLAEDDPRLRNLNGYGGSIAFAPDGETVAVSSPRGDRVQIMDVHSAEMTQEHNLADVCGLATAGAGWVATTGLGQVLSLSPEQARPITTGATAWDNHLIPVG
ncbi:DUF1513 domain-containing protein [Epibacterium sp. SM1979]|uniref:DUF1513 domain-containing protein n=1 Tax=Tritonibacter litoralis TaxID=2662264 RepID=A0A843YGP9_9RHOB|nr:DUF1513 domain-containing protein [Tritonibacter litoralis]MQQ08845.1 DUF1513 domain-containing protein [Tritonibacter litoralis]